MSLLSICQMDSSFLILLSHQSFVYYALLSLFLFTLTLLHLSFLAALTSPFSPISTATHYPTCFYRNHPISFDLTSHRTYICTYTYSDQLRQRLVRMSVRHHEQLFGHQQREMHLMQSFQVRYYTALLCFLYSLF